MPSTPTTLQNFVNYCQQYIKGDEKGEAQSFLDRLFRAFGHEGAIEAGATYESRIAKGSKQGKTGFADLVWEGRVLIEMKKRGEELSKHYTQAWDYWTRLVPNRPPYVLLCNFDEIWIYDFNTQLDTPVQKIPIQKLPEQSGALSFLEEGAKRKPIFNNNQVEVTERAARRMAELMASLVQRHKNHQNIDEQIIQRFVLQCVLAMFAEDRALLPRDMFIECVRECLAGASSYDVIGGLFREMNTKGITPAGRYKGTDYFNGGLFAVVHPLELTHDELELLDRSAREDWSKVRPAIFGSLFEATMDQVQRHAHGIHFTSETDIMKIVRPTISRYWEEKIDSANTIGELNSLQIELQSYRVLDPACGSGNFLYLAYQELKRLEKVLLDKLADRRKIPVAMTMGLVSPSQFFGMDTNPFAVELARVTLMIARKVAVDNLGLTEPCLPLDTLDDNIRCVDALFTPWPQADAVIGNPPFLGGKHMRIVLGDEYIDRVFAQFPDVKDSVDFCTYWFRLAQDHIGKDGRAGLVATNSVSQGKSRAAALDYIVQEGGYIHEAVSSQVWSGEAKVHVSIVNWSLKLPGQRFLDDIKVSRITSSLKSITDVVHATRLNSNLEKCFQGVIPLGIGFIITKDQVDTFIQRDPRNREVLKLFSMGTNLAQNQHGKPDRWVIDFTNMDIEEASTYSLPFEHIHRTVKPHRDTNRRETRRLNWWKFGENAPKMRRSIAPLQIYFAVPEVSKYAYFVPCLPTWLPGNKNKAVASDDFYVFGVLTSLVHRTWMFAQMSTLEDRIAYTHNTCFETFPFPQNPGNSVEKIRSIAEELHAYRTKEMEARKFGITDLYNLFWPEPMSGLRKIHARLDTEVLKAYGFKANDDLLERLLTLNLELAEKEKQGETVIGPWAPTE
jgi:SAM-dependent methyltransferase